MRLLVVEDDGPLGLFLRKGMEVEGYDVELATDGHKASAMAANAEFDALVLDLNLPGIDGAEVLQNFRNKRKDTPVLVLTARKRVEDRVHMLDLGADDYLVKPFSFTELTARLRALLRRGNRIPESMLRFCDLELN